MTRPEVVLFDLGKVLVDFDWTIAARHLAKRSRFSADQLVDFVRKSDLLPRYESGQLTSQAFFGEIQRGIDYQGTFDDFAAGFADIFSPIPEMIQLHARVRAAGYATYIFSNTNDLAVRHIRRHYPFFANFTGYFLSYELGMMKPDAGIYEAAERTTGCAGRQVLYLDDFPENIAAGAQRAWQTIHHISPRQTIPQVERLLF